MELPEFSATVPRTSRSTTHISAGDFADALTHLILFLGNAGVPARYINKPQLAACYVQRNLPYMTHPIPQPRRIPFLGNITSVNRAEPAASLLLLAEQYGEVYRLDLLGTLRTGPQSYCVF